MTVCAYYRDRLSARIIVTVCPRVSWLSVRTHHGDCLCSLIIVVVCLRVSSWLSVRSIIVTICPRVSSWLSVRTYHRDCLSARIIVAVCLRVSSWLSARIIVAVCPHVSSCPPPKNFRDMLYWGLTENLSTNSRVGQSRTTMSGTCMKTEVFLHCCLQYEIFCSWATVQREPVLAFLWQHSAVLYSWQLRVGQ